LALEFMLEIGCEELPARYVESTLDQLQSRLSETLRDHRLELDSIESFATPRRLILVVRGLVDKQPDRVEIITGPPFAAGFDSDGQPTAAARGFAAKHGHVPEQLQGFETEKGKYLALQKKVAGRDSKEILAAELPVLLRSLEFPKNMHWEESGFLFVRPIRWILCLLAGEVVSFRVAGIEASNYTFGHRILASDKRIEVNNFQSYESCLLNNKVKFDPQDRRTTIEAKLLSHATAAGLRLVSDKKLLQHVVFLNEFPSVVTGRFAPEFLRLPREVLVTVMREHQKYFSLEDHDARLQPRFLAVVDSDGSASDKIRMGHERVLRARLTDASFFWDVDRKVKLEDRVRPLERILFQQKLGTMLEKTQRLVALAEFLGRLLGRNEMAGDLRQAARLAKTDLATEMVKEFTDLQGVMGGLYGRAEGVTEAVCDAIYEHYRPATLEDESPKTWAGAVLSIADKLDSVVGAFSVGQMPTGSKDPLALRRQTLALLKVLLDQQLSLSLEKAFRKSLALFRKKAARVPDETWRDFAAFVKERLRFIFKELGFRYDEINAVVENSFDNPFDCLNRLKAIATFRGSTDFESLAQSFKRIKNILLKSGEELSPDQKIDPALLEQEEEQQLAARLAKLQPKVQRACRSSRYSIAFELMASLRPEVDRFFDRVLVMSENPAVRRNRICLLNGLMRTFLGLADVSEIVVTQE